MSAPYLWSRIILSIAFISFWSYVTIILLFGDFKSSFGNGTWDALTCIGIILILLGSAYLVVSHFGCRKKQNLPKIRHFTEPGAAISLTDAIWRVGVRESGERLDENADRLALFLLVQMLIGGVEKPIVRTSQVVTLTTRSHRIHTTHMLVIPQDLAGKRLAIPVARAVKGQLIDEFKAYDNSDTRLSALPQEESVAHFLACIRAMILDEEVLKTYHAGIDGKEALESNVARLICKLNTTDEEIRKLRQNLISQIRVDGAVAELITLLLVRLRSDYPQLIMVKVPECDESEKRLGRSIHIQIAWEKRSLPMLEPGGSFTERLADHVRLFLGVRPAIVTCSLMESTRCRSYHLELFGPEGTYLARQRLVDAGGSNAREPVKDIKYNWLDRYGQEYGHLYIRNRHPGDLRRLQYSAHFYERSPGSIAPAALSAIAAAGLISLAAAIKLIIRENSNVPADIVAILLTLPIVAGSWAGIEASGGIFGGALNAKLSRMATMALSVFAAAYYILFNGEVDGHRAWSEREGSNIWIALGSLAVLNAVLSSASWFIRTNAQAALMKNAGGNRP